MFRPGVSPRDMLFAVISLSRDSCVVDFPRVVNVPLAEEGHGPTRAQTTFDWWQ